MFTVAWLDERRRKHRNLRTTRIILAGAVNENVGLRAQLDECRRKLGLERLARAVEVESHKETCEHLRLMSKDCQRLEWENARYRQWWYAQFDDAMPGITDKGDE